ncbi:MAG: response regulator [Polyangiaceae bacterium]
MEKKQLGRILLKRKLISPEQLESALSIQRREPMGRARPIASVLTDEGFLDETDAIRALSEQFGLPGLDLSRIVVELSTLDFVPEDVAVERQMLPVLVQDDQLFLAMSNPNDQKAIDELEFVTGRKVRPYVVVSSSLLRATHQAYAAKASGAQYYFGPRVPADTRRELEPDEELLRTASVPPPGIAAPTARSLDQDAPPEALGPTDWSTVAQLPQEPHSSPNATGKLVLIVEDEAEIRKLLVRLVESRGHRTMEADRGPQALECVRQVVPDLIILDAMLPELHGFEIARRLKSSDRYKKIPILMMSAVHRGWRIAEDAKSNLRIDEYMEKPFRVSEVAHVIDRLLASRVETPDSGVRKPDDLAEDARQLLEESTAAYRAGDPDRACSLLRRATEVDPLAFRPHYHLGLLFAKLDRPYDAITELEKAVEIHPKSFAAMKNLALLYEKSGFRNKAVEVWERCIQATDDLTVQTEIRTHLLTLLT